MNNNFNNQLLDQNAQQQYLNQQYFETQGGNTQKMNQFQCFYHNNCLDQGEVQDRIDFFKKVYSFLTIEFLLNLGMIALGLYTRMRGWLVNWYEKCPPQKDHCEYGFIPSWLFYVSLFVSLILQFTLYFGGNILRKAPRNYIVLVLYIVFYGFTFTTISIVMIVGWLDPVWIIWGITFLIIVSFTIFGFLNTREISLQSGAIIIVGTTIPIILTLILVDYYLIWEKVVCALIIIMYGFYLMLETRLIFGKGRLNLQPDDYLIGSLLLYGLLLQPVVRIVEFINDTFGNRNK